MQTILFLVLVFLCGLPAARAGEPLPRREWTVDGVVRSAVIHAPPSAATQPTPLIFAFHGHGGTGEAMARKMPFHEAWPEAIVVYPQGLNTPSRLVDPEGKRSGWQTMPGTQEDRDLHFFDTMLASLRKDYQVDPRRVFVTGHSHGSAHVYLLWATRSEQIAAFAPSASRILPELQPLAPRPVCIVAGENDRLVKYEWQKAGIDQVLAQNQCGPGRSWQPGSVWHPSPIGAPVVTLIHHNGHPPPPEALTQIVRFFQEIAAGAK